MEKNKHRMLQLVQLSDLHIGGAYFRQEIFDTIINEVNNKLKPDVILITGDLTDEGLYHQLKRASLEIKKFTDVCPNVIILPGNHDYRHTGYLLFNKFFSSSPSSSSNSSYSSSSRMSNINSFDRTLIITLATARPDRDEGEVGHRQKLWLERVLSDKKYRKHTKIIAMHHHLIGVPDTGTDKIVIVDAGDILRTCIKYKIDLVLCGHKHRPWLWNLETLDIAYAGTASSTRFRGFTKNTYNIIEIDDDGKINIDIKIVGGRRLPLIDILKMHRPFPET
ncbi:MAG TPA: metallophosphoesterase [Nitrososphaeraceae archaeon]|nr:metallophosphoesterase [Nitrososphaeraceae archaeon]